MEALESLLVPNLFDLVGALMPNLPALGALIERAADSAPLLPICGHFDDQSLAAPEVPAAVAQVTVQRLPEEAVSATAELSTAATVAVEAPLSNSTSTADSATRANPSTPTDAQRPAIAVDRIFSDPLSLPESDVPFLDEWTGEGGAGPAAHAPIAGYAPGTSDLDFASRAAVGGDSAAAPVGKAEGQGTQSTPPSVDSRGTEWYSGRGIVERPGGEFDVVGTVRRGEGPADDSVASRAPALPTADSTPIVPGTESARQQAPPQPFAQGQSPTGGLSDTGSAVPNQTADLMQGTVAAQISQLPLSFEVNAGQAAGDVVFRARGSGYGVTLTASAEAIFSAHHQNAPDAQTSGSLAPPTTTELHMRLVGAKPAPEVQGEGLLPTVSNYYSGNDPSQWHTGIPHYSSVLYHDVYPGIDEVFRASPGGGVEYDFRVAPGADPGAIRLQFDGATNVAVSPAGDLILHTRDAEFRQTSPVLYQTVDGVRQQVGGGFVLDGQGQIGFAVGAYDPTLPLVIDPAAPPPLFTYLGNTGDDWLYGIAIDNSGAYVTGASYQPGHTDSDVVVAKLNTGLTNVAYYTYISTADDEAGYAIAVAGGQAYVTGFTKSNGFPTTPGVVQPGPRAAGRTDADAFVSILNGTGALAASTYLGGTDTDYGYGIAVSGDSVYVTGTTGGGFPTKAGAYQFAFGGGTWDGFVTRLDANLTATGYSTYLGGGGYDDARAIAVENGFAYVTGFTNSAAPAPFPTSPTAKQGALAGPLDAFVTKLDQAGAALSYSTYLGGGGSEHGYGIAVSGGYAYVTGDTDSNNFPTSGAPPQPALGGGVDAFITKLYFARFPHTRTPKTAEKMRGPSNNGPFGGFGKPAQKAANP